MLPLLASRCQAVLGLHSLKEWESEGGSYEPRSLDVSWIEHASEPQSFYSDLALYVSTPCVIDLVGYVREAHVESARWTREAVTASAVLHDVLIHVEELLVAFLPAFWQLGLAHELTCEALKLT